ncbi:zinc finger protein 773-like isoform X2 [Nerophis ophidion]|uniref:zinc finger protein 773-like isoform X2 n=1 Tax=Nerophis ophidion TaxID=159077 RepID=UPI002ADFB23B|nr:zinc finger protein 773-like isoform X2 [Nerophis ophidion]
MCERTIAKYEEELCPTKEEKERQQLLDAVFKKHEVVLHRTDVQQPPHIKEEEAERRITREGECLLGQEEADLSKFPLTVVSVKTEEHEDKPPESSQLHHSPNVQQTPRFKEEEEEVWITQEEECLLGQEEADLSKFPLTVVSVKTEEHEDKAPESSQLHHSPNVCEEQLLPEKQECRMRMVKRDLSKRKTRRHGLTGVSFSSLTQTLPCKKEEEDSLTHHIKGEEEEHSIGQEGECLEWLDEFPEIGVPVKSEGDEVKGESEERGGGEPPSSSSTQHMTTEADGDHCGGSQADKLLAPLSDSEDTTSHSPDTDDEDSKEDKTCHTDNTLFECSHCDKTFKYHSHLKRHMIIHTGVKPFSCSICGLSFTRKDNMKEHTRTHKGEKPFSCSVCDSRYARSQCLKLHLKRHTGENLFTCSVCSSSFVRAENLKTHMRTHTGEKPFSCSVCGVFFTQSASLNKHMRTHTGVKPFSCSVCETGFVHKNNLKTHMRIHTGEKPFSCSLCGLTFTRKEHMKEHTKTHTGEKPFSCSVCDSSFARSQNLKKHMRIHTEEKVLSCSVCGERFSHEYQLNKHKCAGETSSSIIERHSADLHQAEYPSSKESFKRSLNPNDDQDQHQNLITCSLSHF